jgi:hypothetical protein
MKHTPLCTFVGDKRAGQTTGEGLSNFGAEPERKQAA